MRFAPIILAITLCVSDAHAMWPFFSQQPKPVPEITLTQRAQIAALIVVGVYVLVCDGGIISWFESDHPRGE